VAINSPPQRIKCATIYTIYPTDLPDTEQAHEDENEDTEVMGPPKKTRGATRKAASKSTLNMELESKRLDMERDRMKYEHELRLMQMEIELARINVVESFP
jgi:hypothetical protein